jgi:hypothetical protein
VEWAEQLPDDGQTMTQSLFSSPPLTRPVRRLGVAAVLDFIGPASSREATPCSPYWQNVARAFANWTTAQAPDRDQALKVTTDG